MKAEKQAQEKIIANIRAAMPDWRTRGAMPSLRSVCRRAIAKHPEAYADELMTTVESCPHYVPDLWRWKRVWLGKQRYLSMDFLEVVYSNPMHAAKFYDYGGLYNAIDFYPETKLHFRLFVCDRFYNFMEVGHDSLVVGAVVEPTSTGITHAFSRLAAVHAQ